MERAHAERLVGITPEAACDQLVWLASADGRAFEPTGEYFVKRRVGRAHRITLTCNARASYGSGRRHWSVREA